MKTRLRIQHAVLETAQPLHKARPFEQDFFQCWLYSLMLRPFSFVKITLDIQDAQKSSLASSRTYAKTQPSRKAWICMLGRPPTGMSHLEWTALQGCTTPIRAPGALAPIAMQTLKNAWMGSSGHPRGLCPMPCKALDNAAVATSLGRLNGDGQEPRTTFLAPTNLRQERHWDQSIEQATEFVQRGTWSRR